MQRNQVSALLSAADSSQLETERDMQSVEKEYERMDSKLRKAAEEEVIFTATPSPQPYPHPYPYPYPNPNP